MNENQEALKTILKQQKNKLNQIDLQTNKAVIHELLRPLQTQVDEIKQIYENTKKCANEVNDCLNTVKKGKKLDLDNQPQQEKDFVDKFDNYISAHQQLRTKFNEADDLAQTYKQKFKDLETFESESYLKNLNKMNRELRDLEQRSAKGQQELESRIEAVNRRYNLVLPATYIDAIQKNIKNIDLLKVKESIDERLGGEFDYNEFQADIDKIIYEVKKDKDQYMLDMKQFDVYVPEKPSKADRDYFEQIQNAPSILDTLKQRINAIKIQAGAEPSVIPVSTAQQPAGRGSHAVRTTLLPAAQPSKLSTTAITSAPTQAPQPSTILTKPKKSNMFNKPEHLRRIHSKPMPCAVDLRFRKLQPDSGDYNTFFDDPDPRDAADVERRQNEPYADQLGKEYAAQKQREEDNKPLEPDFTKRKEPAKLPPSRPVNQDSLPRGGTK